MKAREARSRLVARTRRRALPLALLAALAPLGCSREFFREWANQDVSEAIFEKSRDPRFRIDVFSIAPPQMARYAHPYDPDFPPSPPDDFASQSLSPIPQWSKNQLLVPVEGTGYIPMLEQFTQENERTRALPPADEEAPANVPAPRQPDPPPPGGPAPFNPGPYTPTPARPSGTPAPNSGTPARELSPLSVPGRAPALPTPDPAAPATTPGGTSPPGPQARSKPKDDGVRLAALQAPTPVPASTPGQIPTPIPGQAPRTGQIPATGDSTPSPRIPGVEGPQDVQDLSKPVNPRIEFKPQQNQAVANELSGLYGTGKIDFNESIALGLPKDAKPYRINLAQSLTLALINARVYQFNLEQLYLAALPVTLQRFAFAPQFIAGLSPTTPTVGPGTSAAASGAGLSPVINPSNAFSYRTRATGLGQQSTLNMGTVAAVGKSFDNGAKILAGFASQVVFNFTGVNPRQPTVQSFLPIQAVVPFLKGGGRAVTLEALTQAERNLLYQIRLFTKFRQEFLISTLTGNNFVTFGTTAQATGFSGPGNVDPTIGYLNVVEDVAILENYQRNVETFVQFSKVYKELIKGEASGLTQLQLDQLDTQVQGAKLNYYQARNTFRGDLDGFKVQLGLPPDIYFMIDRGLTLPFKKVFDAIEVWARDPRRQLTQLDEIARGLPELEDIIIDGRSCVNLFKKVDDQTPGNNPDEELEDLLLAAERISMENRLDLMNQRAALYDAWRQIRVAANALKGVFNVTVTNEILTPPTTTNPFAFLSQAKQFSLVLNAELPLVRINERNNFMTQLINYERQRRLLMSQEDYIKLQIRGDIRSFQLTYLTYALYKRNFVLYARQKDQAFENIIAPPQSGGGAGGGAGTGSGNAGTNASGAIQTQNLISAQSGLIGIENNLVTQWYNYQQARLIVYRDLGNLPYDEWEAFYES